MRVTSPPAWIGTRPLWDTVDGEPPLVRIHDEMRDCVFFAAAMKDGKGMIQSGSGFLVAVPLGDTGQHVVYAVTAKHVLFGEDGEASDEVLLTLNAKSGRGTLPIKTKFEQWQRHTNADVAVCNVALDHRYQFTLVPPEMFATAAVIAEKKVGPGDDVFATGLLVYHPGKTRNMPIVRLGCISALPDDPIRVSTGNGYARDKVALTEVRSLGGLSGSPVFVHFPFFRDLPGGRKVLTSPDEEQVAYSGGRSMLLGVMHGLFEVDANDPEKRRPAGFDRALNAGIAVVTYADRILELINDTKEVEARRLVEEQINEQNMPIPAGTGETDGSFERFKELTRQVINTPKVEPEDES